MRKDEDVCGEGDKCHNLLDRRVGAMNIKRARVTPTRAVSFLVE